MLNLFKKTKEVKEVSIYAPCIGIACALGDVKDAMFSQKMLGDGVAILPLDGELCAPCAGTITMIAPTKHAFGITTKHGAELLIHVGLDTVNLQGKGLEVVAKLNQKVEAGDPILKVDMEFMKENQIDLTTPIILTNGAEYDMEVLKEAGEVGTSIEMMRIGSK